MLTHLFGIWEITAQCDAYDFLRYINILLTYLLNAVKRWIYCTNNIRNATVG